MIHHIRALNPAVQPLCSVCIANYNGRDTLADCLESVLQQTSDFSVEIIVHDDKSSDDSVAFLQTHYPNIELLISQENVGFCISNNRMVDIARGEFILLLNNDAALYPDALVCLYRCAQQQTQPAILSLPQYAMQDDTLIDRGHLFDLFLNPIPNLNLNQQDVGQVIGACFWLSKQLWQELGGFPPWFDSVAEDTFLCCYARLKGYPVKVLPQSGFKHWLGNSLGGAKITNNQLHTTFRRRALSERNKTFVMCVCYPTYLAVLILPLHGLLLVLEGFILSVLKRDKRLWREIYWHCFQEVWRNRGQLWKYRSLVQSQRWVSLRQFLKPHSWLPYKLRLLWRHGIPTVK